MKKTLWMMLLPAALLVACDDVVVEAPDLVGATDNGSGGQDTLLPDPGSTGDVREDFGLYDPGADETPVDVPDDPGQADVGGQDAGPTDTGVDLNETPMPGNHECITGQGCLSGVCRDHVCTCASGDQCDEGMWCDAGETSWQDSGRCMALRDVFDGCLHHEQCASGACDFPVGADSQGYCAYCSSRDNVGCTETTFCCGGRCAEGCLGCAISMEFPNQVQCLSGCFDPDTQYCSPTGPAAKLPMFEDCRFNNSWCATDFCKTSSDGASSWCACDGDDDCAGSAICLDGGCAID